MARKSISSSMTIAYIGHMVGTGVLCIPQLYSLQLGVAVASIVASYGAVLLSFFVLNLSCEVSLGQLRKSVDKDAAAGLQMGIIKSMLSVGKVSGAAMVALTFRLHPQLPLWMLEGLLVVGAILTVAYDCFIAEDGEEARNAESERNGSFRQSIRFSQKRQSIRFSQIIEEDGMLNDFRQSTRVSQIIDADMLEELNRLAGDEFETVG